MEKYPILNGRQRKMWMSKVELPEAQVLMALTLGDNVWIRWKHRQQ